MRYKIKLALAVITVIIFTSLAAACFATDTWTDLMPGVRYLHRVTSTPWQVHVLVIDLTNPRVRLKTAIKHDNDKPDDGETVRSMCQRYHAVGGINCDYFAFGPDPNPIVGDHSHIPQGFAMTDGLMMLPPDHTSPIVTNRTTMSIPVDNSYAVIGKVVSTPAWWFNVAAGGPKILQNGAIWQTGSYTWDAEGLYLDGLNSRDPRTGAAISQDWHTLVLAAVDGRQSGYSVGVTVAEMATLLKEFGGYTGMTYDGGGSTTMVINGVTVNNPSDGHDRAIANCLMVLDRAAQGDNPSVKFESQFENLPYFIGSLNGVDGWVGGGDAAANGRTGQCARFFNASAYRNVSSTLLSDVQWVECWVKPTSTNSNAYLYTGTSNASNVASAVRFGASGKIEALDGDGSGGGTWTSIGTYTANTWYRIHIRLDYNTDNYQAFVNGAMKISGAGFMNSGAASGLAAMKIQENGTADFYVDDIYAGNVDPDYLRVSPDITTLVAGIKKQFVNINSSVPITWRIVNEKNSSGNSVAPGTIATISSAGLVTSLSAGSFTVEAQDNISRIDRTSQISVLSSQSLTSARSLADGSSVAMNGVVVTAVFNGYVYIEQPDRRAGIRVITTKPVSEGSSIYLVGTMGTVNGERVIYPTVFDVSQ